MNTEAGAYINSRLVSSSQKREIMWNIIEPGDPYDIRKYSSDHQDQWSPDYQAEKILWENICR